jgi:hypothetical protein
VCTCNRSKLGRDAHCVHKFLLLSMTRGQRHLPTHMEVNNVGAHVRFFHECDDGSRIYGVQRNRQTSPIRTFVCLSKTGDYCSGKKEGCTRGCAHLKYARVADVLANRPPDALRKVFSPEEVARCVAFLDGLTEPAPLPQAAIGFVNQLQVGGAPPPSEAPPERPRLVLLGLPSEETGADKRAAPLKRRSKNFGKYLSGKLAVVVTPERRTENQLAVVGGEKPSAGRGRGAIKCVVQACLNGRNMEAPVMAAGSTEVHLTEPMVYTRPHTAPDPLVVGLAWPVRVSELSRGNFDELHQKGLLVGPRPLAPPPCNTAWKTLPQPAEIVSLDWSLSVTTHIHCCGCDEQHIVHF